MVATAVIGTILFAYAGWMTIRSINNVKKALKGDGCMGCDGSCQDCNVITNIQFD